MPHRPAKLHRIEPKSVPESIRRLHKFLEFRALLAVEQVELIVAVRERAQSYAEKTNPPLQVSVFVKQCLDRRENIRIKIRRRWKRFRSCISIESLIPNRQR